MKLREVPFVLTGTAMLALAILALGAPTASADSNGNYPDVIEVRHYQVTLDKAQKAAAAIESVNQLVAVNPGLNGALTASAGTTGKKTITQQAQDIDSQYPQIAAIIHRNGLAMREFIVVTSAIMNDMGWVGMKKQGMIKDYPTGMITPGNAALIEANWTAFQEITAEMTPPNTN